MSSAGESTSCCIELRKCLIACSLRASLNISTLIHIFCISFSLNWLGLWLLINIIHGCSVRIRVIHVSFFNISWWYSVFWPSIEAIVRSFIQMFVITFIFRNYTDFICGDWSFMRHQITVVLWLWERAISRRFIFEINSRLTLLPCLNILLRIWCLIVQIAINWRLNWWLYVSWVCF